MARSVGQAPFFTETTTRRKVSFYGCGKHARNSRGVVSSYGMPSHRNVLIVSEKVAVQLCRLLRPRDSCAKCGCCASPGGVTHLREKKGSPRWAKIPASRKYEKTRARSSYRKRTSRYASRARATARCARRALHPTNEKGGQGGLKLKPKWLR